MSTINAASVAQVRYAATLALRCGQVPSLAGVRQPTLSAAQFQQVKNGLTVLIGKAIIRQPKAPVAPHQVKLVAAMAAQSGVVPPALSGRQQADNVAIAWFKANGHLVPALVAALQPSS